MSGPAAGYICSRSASVPHIIASNRAPAASRSPRRPQSTCANAPFPPAPQQCHKGSKHTPKTYHKDSGLEFHSEFEGDQSSPSTIKKSSSLISLNQSNIFEPRMAQLETLEAKMASIEVSLSATPRRKKNGSLTGSVRSIAKEVTTKELETLRNALRDKENIIQTLKGQLNMPAMMRLNHSIRTCANNNNNVAAMREFSEAERRQAEERLTRLRNDTDAKRLAIKNLKMALDRLDITDNIDVRIQQAELEYQLGREELNLLTLLEETRSLQHCLEESSRRTNDSHTLYSCLITNDILCLHVVEVNYDPKSPRFGAGQTEMSSGLFVDWALDETGLQKGDRLIEVNGKIVLTKSRDDLTRLLQAAPDPATLVLLRKGSNGKVPIINSTHNHREVAALRCELELYKDQTDEAQRAKDGLRSDNIRLTHRISYLEEQVSELLARKTDADIRVLTQSPMITSTVKTSQNVTNINISSHPHHILPNGHPNGRSNGPQNGQPNGHLVAPPHTPTTGITARSKSSLSNVSNTIISAPSPQPSEHACQMKLHRHAKHRSRSNLLLTASNQHLDGKKAVHTHNHHHHHHHKDYNSETNSAVEYRASPRRWADQLSSKLSEYTTNGGSLMDQSYRKATKIVQDLTKHSGHLYEKHKTKNVSTAEKQSSNASEMLKQLNARKSTSVMDFRAEIQLGPKYSPDLHHRPAEIGEPDEGPPRKESMNGRRLYKKLHDLRSVKSLDFDSDRNVDYASEPSKPKPTPPKKPLRLSLHRAQSLQSVETPPATPNGSPPNDNRKAQKRNHRGEAPLVNGGSMNALHQGIVMNTEKVNGYSVANGHMHSAKVGDAKWTSFAQKPQSNYSHSNNGIHHPGKKEILKEMPREQREQRDRPVNWC